MAKEVVTSQGTERNRASRPIEQLNARSLESRTTPWGRFVARNERVQFGEGEMQMVTLRAFATAVLALLAVMSIGRSDGRADVISLTDNPLAIATDSVRATRVTQ